MRPNLAELGRRGGRLADVVGLHGALCDDRIGALFDRLTDQEFQFTGFVAAGRETGALVAFDIDRRSVQGGRKIYHRFQRRRTVAQAHPRKSGQVHDLPRGIRGVSGTPVYFCCKNLTHDAPGMANAKSERGYSVFS